MSAISLILLVAAAIAVALGAAALHTVRGLRGELVALRTQLAAAGQQQTADAAVPSARTADAERPRAAAQPATVGGPAHSAIATAGCGSGGAGPDEIRTAVAEALAEERERELAEARAFWAAQEARDAENDNGSLLAGQDAEYEYGELPDSDPVGPSGLEAALLDALLEGRLEDSTLDALGKLPDEGSAFIPRQVTRDDVEPDFDHGPEVVEPTGPGGHMDRAEPAEHLGTDLDPAAFDPGFESGEEPPELAAARRRHPSQRDYNLNGDPVVPAPASPAAPRTTTDRERTLSRLTELAEEGTPLADVRPGPLGTLDVYVFADGTTVCLSPGHHETADLLTGALQRGEFPVLMGGSAISGAYALTFAYGSGHTVYLLADRVIASL